MEIKISKKDLQKALDELDESVKSYCTIQSTFKNSKGSIKRDFQKLFNSFHKIRRSKDWQNIYYKYFERASKGERLQFHDLLIVLHKQTGNIEASYCTKLINKPNASRRLPARCRIIKYTLCRRACPMMQEYLNSMQAGLPAVG